MVFIENFMNFLCKTGRGLIFQGGYQNRGRVLFFGCPSNKGREILIFLRIVPKQGRWSYARGVLYQRGLILGTLRYIYYISIYIYIYMYRNIPSIRQGLILRGFTPNREGVYTRGVVLFFRVPSNRGWVSYLYDPCSIIN